MSLLETILACSLLSLALLACFELFLWGTRSFHLSQKRLGLEGEGRRIRVALQADLQRADSNLMSFDRTRNALNLDAETVPRHAYCIPSLQDWQSAASFDSDETVPRWDRFVVVYATTEAEGKLVKRLVDASGGPHLGPLTGSPGAFAAQPPVTGSQLLSPHLERFELTWDEPRKALRVDLTLAARGGKKGQARRILELHQLVFTQRLENSALL